jgi:hypothetical protein
MTEYNIVKAIRNNNNTNNATHDVSSPKDTQLQLNKSLTTVPRTLSGDLQPDGICRFRQHLSSLEHFIFDHCKSSAG